MALTFAQSLASTSAYSCSCRGVMRQATRRVICAGEQQAGGELRICCFYTVFLGWQGGWLTNNVGHNNH
jgi:hypothetical protein